MRSYWAALTGRTEHAANGGKRRYLDKRAKKKARTMITNLMNNIEQVEGMYFVEGEEGVVVTAGHHITPVQQDFSHAKRQAKARARARQ